MTTPQPSSRAQSAEAWRWICPVCDQGSQLLIDETQARAEFIAHADRHALGLFLPLVLDKPLNWRRGYALKEQQIERPRPTAAEIAREASQAIASLLDVATAWLRACACGSANPTFDATAERVKVGCASCGKHLQTVTGKWVSA